MCFAPEADLVAGITVTVIGIDALRRNTRPELVPLAALPVVFGVHQLIETLVWWNLRGGVPDCVGKPAAWTYALIALSVVPVLVPFAFGRAGAISSPTTARALLGCGVVSGAILLVTLVLGTMHATIDGHHLNYHVGTPWVPFTLGLYIVATCAPGLLANTPTLRIFGATNLLVVAALIWLAQSAVVSLWCVWAAISSVLINVYVRRRRGPGGRVVPTRLHWSGRGNAEVLDPRTRKEGAAMYIGLGIVLLVLGLVLNLDVITVDIKYVDDDALGTILIVAGILAIVLSLVMAPPWRRERHDTVVHEHHGEPPLT